MRTVRRRFRRMIGDHQGGKGAGAYQLSAVTGHLQRLPGAGCLQRFGHEQRTYRDSNAGETGGSVHISMPQTVTQRGMTGSDIMHGLGETLKLTILLKGASGYGLCVQ